MQTNLPLGCFRSKVSTCLLVTDPRSQHAVRLPHKLPGMHYSANEQCQILFGTNATFCRNMEVSSLGRGRLAQEGASGFCWRIQAFTLHTHTHKRMCIHACTYMHTRIPHEPLHGAPRVRHAHTCACTRTHTCTQRQGDGSELLLTPIA